MSPSPISHSAAPTPRQLEVSGYRRVQLQGLLTYYLLYSQCTVDDSGPPCAECALHNRECIIDELADKRRKVAAKETEENLKSSQKDLAKSRKDHEITQGELEYYRSYVRYLLDAIRFGQLDDVNNLIAVIRRGATEREIGNFISQFGHLAPRFSLDTPGGSDSTNGEDGTPVVDGPTKA